MWEIKGKGMAKPSYLFGTMHVSSKMAFNLSDSFYIGLKNAQVVALETNPGTWQEDYSKYDMANDYRRLLQGYGTYNEPRDYLSINSLKLTSYEKLMEAALYSSPSVINSFLYRSDSEYSSDFEEDTYLDLHIFQAGRKLGKKVCGVEDFDGSMQLVKEAYADAAKEKVKKERSYDVDDDLSFRHLEEAYRTGNLDLLDTINKVNSRSAAFDEKFMYKRNEIQAKSIDSILKKGQTLFVGVGAAHLPGQRGVIEMLRQMGYSMRPIKMKTRDHQHKEAIEKIRVPVQFSKQSSEDGFYSANVPGKLYSFGPSFGGATMKQYADMTNGSYYMVVRILTNAAILGQTEAQVVRKIDSVLYENIPGKILSRKAIVRNGYRGFDISNRTRRGDHQRYHIFVTPFEIFIFKMSGNGTYVTLGTEAEQFFSSIQLKEVKPETAATGWKKFTPATGGFEVELPQEPLTFEGNSRQYAAYDAPNKTAFAILRADVHNHDFLEEDSFDLNLMEESFASSEFIERQLSRKQATVGGYPALDVTYRFKDSSVAMTRFVINGPRYYTLVAKGSQENKAMQHFIQSFRVKPFTYGEAKLETDTTLFYTVKTPVPLYKKKKLDMFPPDVFRGGYQQENDDSLTDHGKNMDQLIQNESTGEKIYISFYKPSAYYFEKETTNDAERDMDETDWFVYRKKIDTLANKTVVTQVERRHKKSSRMLLGKSYERDGISHWLGAQADTVLGAGAFVTTFFDSFRPIDTLKGVDVSKKKTALFFAQYFSADSTEHNRAVRNIYQLRVDSTDFALLKKSIKELSWKEKKYLELKKIFLGKLSLVPTNAAADYLKSAYYAAGDTVELQYAALEALLDHANDYSYKTFAAIMENDPPVLDLQPATASGGRTHRDNYVVTAPSAVYNEDYDDDYRDGGFMAALTDSVQLTARIYKQLLPLINLDDYEQSIMELTATLLDSNVIKAQDYETYLPKFIIEAKQALKKQFISEKTKAIEKAQKDETDEQSTYRSNSNDADYGNSRLSLYAQLLLPFIENNPQVPAILQQMLSSNDKRLKYNTLYLLLRNKKPVPDTMLNYFASLDEYRFELYNDLEQLDKLSRFPAAYKSQLAIARSEVLSQSAYNKPDTLVFVQKVPLTYKERSGYVYVFKYKESKNDNNWKLATVGLLPTDETVYRFPKKGTNTRKAFEYNFTDFTNTRLTAEKPEGEQVQALLKKLMYSKRRSAAQFYSDSRYDDFSMSEMFRD